MRELRPDGPPPLPAVGVQVLLICMPFAQYKQPSIALSLLKAELAERSVGARVLYPNLRFAERIKVTYVFGTGFPAASRTIATSGVWLKAVEKFSWMTWPLPL